MATNFGTRPKSGWGQAKKPTSGWGQQGQMQRYGQQPNFSGQAQQQSGVRAGMPKTPGWGQQGPTQQINRAPNPWQPQQQQQPTGVSPAQTGAWRMGVPAQNYRQQTPGYRPPRQQQQPQPPASKAPWQAPNLDQSPEAVARRKANWGQRNGMPDPGSMQRYTNFGPENIPRPTVPQPPGGYQNQWNPARGGQDPAQQGQQQPPQAVPYQGQPDVIYRDPGGGVSHQPSAPQQPQGPTRQAERGESAIYGPLSPSFTEWSHARQREELKNGRMQYHPHRPPEFVKYNPNTNQWEPQPKKDQQADYSPTNPADQPVAPSFGEKSKNRRAADEWAKLRSDPSRVAPQQPINPRDHPGFSNFNLDTSQWATQPKDRQADYSPTNPADQASARPGGQFSRTMPTMNTSIQPNDIYSQDHIRRAGNLAAAQNTPAWGDMMAGRSRPGMSANSGLTQWGAGADLGAGLANALNQRQQTGQNLGFANAMNNLAGQTARHQEALGWGGLMGQNWQNQLANRNQYQGNLFGMLSNLYRA